MLTTRDTNIDNYIWTVTDTLNNSSVELKMHKNLDKGSVW